jgi:hypothetical protein
MVSNLNDWEPDSWGEATQTLEMNDPKLGRLIVRLWENLHGRKTATRPMSLIRIERLDDKGNLRVSKPLWLAQAWRRNTSVIRSLATLFTSFYR